jgi:hypothetical protein
MTEFTDSAVEWQTVIVRATDVGPVTHHEFYKAWKTGHLGLVGYGATLNDAIAAMLNKYGE